MESIPTPKKTIGVIGSGENIAELNSLAFQVGIEIAKYNCIVICGGLGGVMEHVCRGAKKQGGTTVGIIPGNKRYMCNPFVDIPIVTNMGEARNILIVQSSQAIIAIGGGYGTLSEICFALKLKIPIVGLKTWDISDDIIKVATPHEAVKLAVKLASIQNQSTE